ncbi:MAG: hypothetical protein J0H31_22565, partial [Alphaproteobacteria bacterium]|nr:hypothetical protein [Alphaproteobacteria bacterium]
EALDEAAALAALRSAYGRGIRACAIALIHAWKYPAQEQRLAAGKVSHFVSPSDGRLSGSAGQAACRGCRPRSRPPRGQVPRFRCAGAAAARPLREPRGPGAPKAHRCGRTGAPPRARHG